jgi:hypothetical protein
VSEWAGKSVDDILSDSNINWTGKDIRARLAEAGFVIVPREPNRTMCDHGWQALGLPSDRDKPRRCFNAMIDAALAEKSEG